jgi:hypothetical protein
MTPPIDAAIRRPIVIDLGAISRKEANRLKRGEGQRIDEACRASQLARSSGAPDVPVILVYRKKSRRRRSRLPFPFPFPLPSL